MSTESKYPEVGYIPFDRAMLSKTHMKFETYHADTPRKADPNDPTDAVNALTLALRPLGWQIGSMAIVRPEREKPTPEREPAFRAVQKLIDEATELRWALLNGHDPDEMFASDLEYIAREIEEAIMEIPRPARASGQKGGR